MRRISSLVYAGCLALFGSCGVVSSEYMDLPGWSEKLQAGRTKNAISAVVGGIIGREIYGNSNVDLEIQKRLFPNARVTGTTTPNSIDTHVDLALTSSDFIAHPIPNAQGYNFIEGTVRKSEFNWNVKQKSGNTYEINRFGPKFDARLVLDVRGGVIRGTYIRPGLHFDWDIEGTYDAEGNVTCTIDGPLNLGVTLDGRVTPR